MSHASTSIPTTPHTASISNTNTPFPSRAPPPVQIDDSSSSFSEVDGEHLKTEAAETYEETAQKTSEVTEETKKKSSDYMQTAREKANEASKYSKEKGSEFADEASDKYDKAKKRAATNAKEAKKEIKSAGQDISENRDNPVYVANGVLLVVGSAALGYGAYTKHVKGELDWQLAGLTAAAVGVLAVGDYYLSQ